MAASFDLEINKTDAAKAFLNTSTSEYIYVELPLMWIELGIIIFKDTVWKLKKILYRIK